MTRFRTLAVILSLMLMAAACSSDDDSAEEADEAEAPVTTEADSGDGDGGDDSSDDASDSDDEEADGDGGDLSGLGILSDDECFEAAQAMAAAFSGGIGGTFEPGEIADAFDKLGAVAPSEIADDLGLVGDTMSEFYGALEDAGVDFNDPETFSDPDLAQVIIEAGESLDTDAFNEALEDVDAWFNENCPG